MGSADGPHTGSRSRNPFVGSKAEMICECAVATSPDLAKGWCDSHYPTPIAKFIPADPVARHHNSGRCPRGFAMVWG